MAGLCPGHARLARGCCQKEDVDALQKAGHDERDSFRERRDGAPRASATRVAALHGAERVEKLADLI